MKFFGIIILCFVLSSHGKIHPVHIKSGTMSEIDPEEFEYGDYISSCVFLPDKYNVQYETKDRQRQEQTTQSEKTQ